MKQRFNVRFPGYVYLTFILIYGIILRIYGLRTAGFDYDQEYAANFASRVINEYPIQMIGQNLSVEGLFMGPWYFYYLTPFFMMTNLHPIGGVIGSIVLGLITVVVYFYVFKSIFGLKAAIIAAILRSSLYSFLGTDLSMTPAFSADLPAILTWFCFYKFWNNSLTFLIPLSFLFGLYTSYHPILFPFYLVFIVIFELKRKIPSWKIIAFAIIAFFIPLAPLIRFEYYHEFLEVKKLLNLGERNSEIARDYSRFGALLNISFFNPVFSFLGTYATDFAVAFGKIWGFLFYLPFLIFVYLKWGFWKNRFHFIVFISTYAIFISYYFLLPVLLTEYYLLGINTLFFIYAVASFSQIKNNVIIFLIVSFLLIINFLDWHQLVSRANSLTLYDKEKIVKQIVAHTLDKRPFFVSYITHPGLTFGYPYLFKIYNTVPSTDPQPQIFNIVSPKSLVSDKFDFESGDVGLILPKPSGF